MTAMINYSDSPRYQRMIQKISTMRPEQRAILSSAAVDQAFGSEAMRSHLQGLMSKADLANKSRQLDISQKRADISHELGKERLGLAKDMAGFEEGQDKFASIVGALNVPVSAYTGYKQMQRDTVEAGKNKRIIDLLQAQALNNS